MQESTTLPIHPRTGLRAVYVSPRTGRRYWPVMGAAEDGDEGEGEGQDGGGGDAKTFEAITSQEALNALIADRVRRAESKGFKSAEEKYKPGHERAEALDNELASEAEKRAREAREDERAKARETFAPKLVRQAFRAEAKGVLTQEQLDGLLEDYNPANYLTDDGDVDEAKIAARVAKFKPATDAGTHQTRGVSFGQGTRPPSKQTQREIGRAAAERRFGTTANK